MSDAQVYVVQNPRKSSPWWLLLVSGALMALAGLSLLFWPFIAASWVLVLILGGVLVSNGIAVLVRRGTSPAAITLGIILIVGGVLAVLFSEITATALVSFVGGTLIVFGVLGMLLMSRLASGASFALLVPGALAVLAGVITLLWPEFALSVVAVLSGLGMLAFGVFMVISAFQFRKRLQGFGDSGNAASYTTIVVD